MKKEIKQQYYFDIKIEMMVPATATYRILAENPEEAFDQINNTTAPNSIKYHFTKKKMLKAMVYDAGCSILKLIKNLGVR